MILVAIGKTSERELLFHRAIKVFRDITKMPQHLVALGHHENGAPFIKGADDINVSITHSGEYLCIALSKDKVGIDIQERKDIDFKKIATRYNFRAESLEEFYDKFTLSEAHAKVSGNGLAPSLHLADQIKGKVYHIIPNHTLSVVGEGESVFIF